MSSDIKSSQELCGPLSGDIFFWPPILKSIMAKSDLYISLIPGNIDTAAISQGVLSSDATTQHITY